ncbi:hypothetical protein SAMN04487926_11615 [Paraburkholderia steynii]|uniref:Uncharacterized protein n=1 Tax=Paraburkholderia steynii TaxID=1245441 RepID=A0A7Z7BBI7_9BURK|nr:hypothetical protein [Paraburkholderia steynii]SDI38548.1 hypothetical protein SAMN04487926_11615 [Paraburkholderia steynii]
MAIVELPVVGEDSSLTDAYDALKASGRSALVVAHEDGPRLYRADILEVQLDDRSGFPMREIRGGHWLPQVDDEADAVGSDGAILELLEGQAIIAGLPDDVAGDFGAALRVYCCSKYSAHIYTAAAFKALPVVGGVRYCRTKDGGIVS